MTPNKHDPDAGALRYPDDFALNLQVSALQQYAPHTNAEAKP